MTRIDPKKIAARTLWDSSALIDALQGLGAASEPVATVLLRESLALARTFVISAVSIAEIWNERPFAAPQMRSVEIADFGMAAAGILAQHFPKSELKKLTGTKPEMKYYGYDALILASGMAHGVDAVISTDKGMGRLAATQQLPCHDPNFYVL